jgi:hypothetical protein
MLDRYLRGVTGHVAHPTSLHSVFQLSGFSFSLLDVSFQVSACELFSFLAFTLPSSVVSFS